MPTIHGNKSQRFLFSTREYLLRPAEESGPGGGWVGAGLVTVSRTDRWHTPVPTVKPGNTCAFTDIP